jgi:hexosaminidase
LKEEHLQDEHALQGYFTNRILKYLEAKGRHGIGWNEILQEGLVEGPIVQYWVRGHQALVEAIRNHRQPVVMSTYLDTYLDHGYSLMPLSRAYKYDPIMAELNEKEAVSILGLEFPLWTEWVPDRARLDYQVYPRMAALAETGWTAKEKKNLDDFLMRLEKFLTRLDKLGVSYAPLKDVEPSLIKQLFGIFTIAIPQKRTAKR